MVIAISSSLFLVSLILSFIVYRFKKKKNTFWSLLVLAFLNVILGFAFMSYFNYIIGLVVLIFPIMIIMNDYFKYKKSQ
uniref:Uncharacterized protein n=1 Tax=Halalkalibacterium halodurans TaxID=86665 RepID=A0A0M0KCF4_ALKHA